MREANQLAANFRTTADSFEREARGSLTEERRRQLHSTAATYRSLARRLELDPPKWLGTTGAA